MAYQQRDFNINFMDSSTPILSILVPTIIGREVQFNKLRDKLIEQIAKYDLSGAVEIIEECDDKKMSIGFKRQILLEKAKGKFIVFIDDDDDVHDNYCKILCDVIKSDNSIDAIGFLQHCIINGGEPMLASLSNKWDNWAENVEEFKYVRTPFFPTPMLKEYALAIGYKDIRYEEDRDFATRLKHSGLIKNEYFVSEIMYYYIYFYAPPQQKYGVNI